MSESDKSGINRKAEYIAENREQQISYAYGVIDKLRGNVETNIRALGTLLEMLGFDGVQHGVLKRAGINLQDYGVRERELLAQVRGHFNYAAREAKRLERYHLRRAFEIGKEVAEHQESQSESPGPYSGSHPPYC